MPPEIEIGIAVNRLALLLQRGLLRRMIEHGHDVRIEEWAVMLQLLGAGELKHGDLAARTFRDRTTLTRLVDGLVERGWVEREPSPEDRRVVLLKLSRGGRSLMQKLLPLAREMLEVALQGLSGRERAALAELIGRVIANMIDDDRS